MVLLVVLATWCSPALAQAEGLAAAEGSAPLPAMAPAPGPVVELLRIAVPADAYGAWLAAEQASWEPWLAQQPGFLDRQLLWDRHRQEGTLLIRWASRAQWKAIPEAEVARVQERFDALARQFTGQASGNPFPLLAEAELEPLAFSAPATVSLGDRHPPRGVEGMTGDPVSGESPLAASIRLDLDRRRRLGMVEAIWGEHKKRRADCPGAGPTAGGWRTGAGHPGRSGQSRGGGGPCLRCSPQ
jgi:uncharacterized protein (TIGR03792 family)